MNNLKFSKDDIKKARDELRFSPKFKQLKPLNILSRSAVSATVKVLVSILKEHLYPSMLDKSFMLT